MATGSFALLRTLQPLTLVPGDKPNHVAKGSRDKPRAGNGAGLAMTTMDLIKLAGGEPANFLDVGGGASAEKIEKAFDILTSDPKVKVILVNIFGGILRCDRVANGLIEAVKKTRLTLPMVVRLQGTNLAEGRKLLEESALTFTVAEGLYEAAEKAVRLSGKQLAS